MTPADVKDLTVSGPLISLWLLAVEPREPEPRPSVAPAPAPDLRRAA